MIICSGCGHANGTTDAFCGSCGGFLEWDGEPVPTASVRARPAAPAASAARSVPEQRDHGLGDRFSVRVEAPPLAVDPDLASPDQVVPDPAPLDLGRVPEAEHERVAPVRPEPLDLGPADLYCGACGAGNANGRSFCRRCGASLADAEPAPRLRWWRRSWVWLRDRAAGRRPLAAGERPERWGRLVDPAAAPAAARRRRRRRLRMPTRLNLGKLALPLAVLSLVGFGIAPIRAAVTRQAFGLWSQGRSVVAPRFVAVTASGASASSATRGHGAAAAIDQNLLTWWSEGRPGRGHGQSLTVRFDRPVDLARVTVHDGAAGAAYPFQPRVRDLRVTLLGPHGVLDERRTLLADKPGLQQVTVSGAGVTRVRLRILSTYAGQRGSAASLCEVAFYEKR